ncbi:MAG: S8 family peptidase, partial [Nanobdellota archaeon]
VGRLLILLLLAAIASAGTMQPFLVEPSGSITVQKGVFNITTGVYCNGTCTNIIAKLDPKALPDVAQTLKHQDRADVVIGLREGANNTQVLDDVQGGFLSAFSKPVKNPRAMRAIPQLTGRISQTALKRLEEHEDVIYVTTVKPVHITLDESVPISTGHGTINGSGKGEGVCVIDTGVSDHSGLEGRIIGEKCYCSDNCCPDGTSQDNSATDDQGHGTHCAGIVAADYNSYQGVAPEANIIAVKVLDSGGSGYSSDIIAGIDWCVSNAQNYNISVISMSLGGGTRYDSACDSQFPGYAQAIDAAVQQNISVIVASGNDGDTTGISPPACVDRATSVGMTYDFDGGGTCWGYVSGDCPGGTYTCYDSSSDMVVDNIVCASNRAQNLDLLAPGAMITSLDYAGTVTDKGGTSMAAPHVAGAAALLKAKYRALGYDLPPDELEQKLQETGKPIYDDDTGLTFKRLNIDDKGVIPEKEAWNGVDPFYSISPNPRNDSCLESLTDATCNITWQVNATKLGTFEFFTIYEEGTEQKITPHFNITVVEPQINITPQPIPILVNPDTVVFNYSVEGETDYCELFIDNQFTAMGTGNFTVNWNEGGSFSWHIRCYKDTLESRSKNMNLTVIISSFSGTDIGAENISNISNLVITTSEATVNFSESVDLSQGGDLDDYIEIGTNRVSIDSRNLQALNKSAQLTISGIQFERPIILRDNEACTDCTILGHEANKITFSVTHFSAYSVSENSYLEVYSSGDTVPYSNITFYANYTNRTSSQPIPDGNCTIVFEDDASEYQMEFDGTLHMHNHSFSRETVYTYTVTCNSTSYTALEASDTIALGDSLTQALGGHRTQLNLTTIARTNLWSFLYGDVNVSVQLGNESIAYDWGQVDATHLLAARSEVDFNNLTCANSTHQHEENTVMGLLEQPVSLEHTFKAPEHDTIRVSNSILPMNTCNTTYTTVNGTMQRSVYKEMVLYDQSATQVVYLTDIYNESHGFDAEAHDYQMIVPENGTDGTPTTYYMYVII